MREISIVMKGNIRRGKGSFISILILIFLVTMSLTAVLTVLVNSSKRDYEAIEEAGLFDEYVMTSEEKFTRYGITPEELKADLEAVEAVEKVELSDVAYGNIKSLSGKKGRDRVLLMPGDSGQTRYRVFKGEGDGLSEEQTRLQSGEVLVPIAFQSIYGCKRGDVLEFKTDGDMNVSYKVSGYFEDPVMGSSVMGVKTILLPEKDINKLCSMDEPLIKSGTFFNIKHKESSTLPALKFQQKLNKETNLMGYADLALSKSQAVGYMLVLTRIFSGILAAFIILLLVIVLIVLGHSINSSIEMEYQNIGILKAVGFTGKKLQAGTVLQYLLAVAAGIAAGVPAAIPVIGAMNRLTQSMTGLCVSDKIAVIPCTLVLTGILCFIILFIMNKVRRISKITPLKAIAQGQEDVYFSDRLQMPVSKRGMNFWLALRQMSTNKKQYISACLITMLLTFFLIMVSGMSSWMGKDGESLNQLFNCFDEDMEVEYADVSLKGEVEEMIKKETAIETSFSAASAYTMLDGCHMYTYVCDTPKEYVTVYEGRTCKYDNEILITQFVADELEIGIGDRVPVAIGNQRADFMVSGIYQSSNDMGSNFAMNRAGYEKLAKEEWKEEFSAYRLKDQSKTSRVVSILQEKYTEQELKVSSSGIFSGMDSIVDAIRGISAIIYVIAAVFALTAVSVVSSKIFARERKDYGIYKALGFSSSDLKIQFAVRFAIVAFVGTVLGSMMDILFGKQCIMLILSTIGVSKMEAETDILSVLIPGIFMIMVFFISAYFKAGRIRKMKPAVLAGE